MGGGGPLAFLNKKTWHTGSLRVIEEVWKREQQSLREQQKVDELRKQVDEERQLQELEHTAAEAGHGRKSQRLDWMYAGGIAAKEDAARRQEEHALGKPAVLEEAKEESKCEQISVLPSFYTEDTPKSANETWARLHNDPLFMIKRHEQTAVQRIRNNPVRMMAIKEEVKKLKSMKDEKKKHKKHKKHKKESKERRHKKEDGSKKRAASSSLEPSPKRQRHTEHRNSHEKSEKDPRYGLALKDEDTAGYKSSQRAAETRKRLEEAGRRKQEEERALKNQRHQRREYRVGQISEEETARRLAEMMGDADVHRQQRRKVVDSARKHEEVENLADEAGRSKLKPQEYSHAAANGVHGRSLEENVASRRYYSQRRSEGATFRR